jgi:Icc-related predicted phosphoesterase
MEDDDNIEQFTLVEEVITKTKKKKSKKCEPKRKYRIIIILLILLNLCIVIMLLYSKPKNDNNEYLDNNSLKFLLLSDIHDNETSLDLLINKIKYKNYNYIFYLGDMVKMTPGQQNSSEHANIYEKRMTQYLKKLEKIAPVLYIPGNNEPYTIYEKNSPKLTSASKNIHNNYIKIKDDLYIMGIGGCVPILNGGKYDKNIIPFSTLNTSNVIQNGFPYNLPQYGLDNYKKSDEWFGNDIKNIINDVKKNAGNNEYQTILLSHNGPLYSWTNAQQQLGTGEHWLYLGSMELEKIFINDEHLILDIHGHIHPSRVINTLIPGKTIINPGAIINGFYGELTLKKIDNKWTVNSMNLLEL